MDSFFYWTGCVVWIASGTVGLVVLLFVITNYTIEFIVNSFNVKKEFLAFAWERLKQRKERRL